jgi:hypothetical protein
VSANLDLVRSIYADWERGDFSRGCWAVSEIEYVRVGWGPEDGTSIGPDGIASVFRSWLRAWRDWKLLADAEHWRDACFAMAKAVAGGADARTAVDRPEQQ